MGKMSPPNLWKSTDQRFRALSPDQLRAAAEEYHRLQHDNEYAERYNHELMEIAIQHAIEGKPVSLSDYADEYERYEAAQEIIDGLSRADQR